MLGPGLANYLFGHGVRSFVSGGPNENHDGRSLSLPLSLAVFVSVGQPVGSVGAWTFISSWNRGGPWEKA